VVGLPAKACQPRRAPPRPPSVNVGEKFGECFAVRRCR
jgi:hypothetical protein